MKLQEYALYKGEEVLCIGTAKECASKLGLKENTIRWYSNEVAQERNKSGNRIIAIRLNEEKTNETRKWK